MGWAPRAVHALRWQLPGGAAGDARECNRLAGELIRSCPALAPVLLQQLLLPRHPMAARGDPASERAQSDSTSIGAADGLRGQPVSKPGGVVATQFQLLGTWTLDLELLTALKESHRRITDEGTQQNLLRTVGRFCWWSLQQELDSAPPLAAATDLAAAYRRTVEAALRTGFTLVDDMLSAWGLAVADSPEGGSVGDVMAALLDALNAGMERDLAAMSAGSSCMPAFQERCHLKSRLLLCGVLADTAAVPVIGLIPTLADGHKADGNVRGSVFSNGTPGTALWAALRREWHDCWNSFWVLPQENRTCWPAGCVSSLSCKTLPLMSAGPNAAMWCCSGAADECSHG